MRKKDYELIASEFSRWYSFDWLSKEEESLIEAIALGIANKLESNNPKFSKDKFMELCLNVSKEHHNE